jgi:1-acyl-sn-glycerol-3-phosphate acyltransferase
MDRDKNVTGKLEKMWAQWVIWSTGIQYDVTGLENLEQENKYIFMSNHESALDILLGVACIPYKIVFLAKKELFRIPVFGWAMQAAGMIKIDRQNPERARKSVDEAVHRLIHSSFSTLIYPEGTRSETGDLLPFKKGGFILAIRSQLPIVPVTIIGAGDVLSKGSFTINQGKIKVIISKPISTQNLEVNNKEELIESCRNTIMKNLTDTFESEKVDYELFSV